jgi:hypothetical protein
MDTVVKPLGASALFPTIEYVIVLAPLLSAGHNIATTIATPSHREIDWLFPVIDSPLPF